jgi:calcium-dependent protein kinase
MILAIPHLLESTEEDAVCLMCLQEEVDACRFCKGGELFKRLLAKGKYSERDAARVMRQILQAVADCHVHGIIHRDLKPENFLYVDASENSLLKLTDFGLSEFFSLQSNKAFNDIAGSAFYVAPEVLRRKYGPSADLWSCGVIMYILVTGEVCYLAPGICQAICCAEK